VDSESYSDFDPSQAPHWSVQVKMVEKPACLLSEYLTEFIQLCNSNRSMQDLLGGLVDRRNLGKNSTYCDKRSISYFHAVMIYFMQEMRNPC